MPVVRLKICSRYMPAFGGPVILVTTIGSVMNGPPSPPVVSTAGAQIRGSISRQAAFLPYRGQEASSLSWPRALTCRRGRWHLELESADAPAMSSSGAPSAV
jgi:hypothetical protein